MPLDEPPLPTGGAANDDPLVVSRVTADDIDVVRWVLYEAVSWTGDPDIPTAEIALQHPQLVGYHDGWGRESDLGVQGHMGGHFSGAATARLFSPDDHGHGFVDAETPELAIAVVSRYRGRGVGRRLMDELAAAARDAGIGRLSLSVNKPNPARLLYESLGYQVVGDDDGSLVMLLDL